MHPLQVWLPLSIIMSGVGPHNIWGLFPTALLLTSFPKRSIPHTFSQPNGRPHQVLEEPFVFYLAISSRSSCLNNSREHFGVSWAWITVPFPVLPHHLVHYYCSPARLKSSKHISYTPWPLQSLSSGLEHNFGEGDKRLTSLLLANFLGSFSVELLPPRGKRPALHLTHHSAFN